MVFAAWNLLLIFDDEFHYSDKKTTFVDTDLGSEYPNELYVVPKIIFISE